MSKLQLARAIARQTGTSTADALRFVRRNGETAARATLREARSGSLKLPATAAVGTGGALAWRNQTNDRLATELETAQTDLERLRLLIESGMDPEDAVNANDDDGDDDDDEKPFELPEWLPSWGDLEKTVAEVTDSTYMMVLMLIVVVLVVQYFLNNSGRSAPVYAGGRP